MFRKLRGKLKEEDIDQVYLAEKLGVCPMAVSHRMTGKTDWRLHEMYSVLELIREPPEAIYIYFPPSLKAPKS